MSTARKIKEAIYDLIDLGSHIDVAGTTKIIAKKLGLNERMIHYTHVEIRNYLHQSKFERVPAKERVLFLPHCLRHAEKCQARQGENGLECAHCGRCQIDRIIKLAKGKGYEEVYVVPGGSLVLKIIERKRPKAILGVACYNEISMAMDKLKGSRIPAIGVLLLRDGCRDTLANLTEIEEKLDLGLKRTAQSSPGSLPGKA